MRWGKLFTYRKGPRHETYFIQKRDLLYTEKRPTSRRKETYFTQKRDLFHTNRTNTPSHTCVGWKKLYVRWQKLFTYGKGPRNETYFTQKRDILRTEKRPTSQRKETYFTQIKTRHHLTHV